MSIKTLKLIFLLSVTSCSLSLAASNSIVPGRSIGHIRLGEAEQRVTAMLGPEGKGEGAMGRFWGVWTLRPSITPRRHELDVLFVRDASGSHVTVEQVRVTSPYFTTRGGIHVGSSLSAVLKTFPGSRRLSSHSQPGKHQTIALWDDVNAGITFEFPAVRRGAIPSAQCRAILVHPRRQGVLDEYAPWYVPNDGGGWVNAL